MNILIGKEYCKIDTAGRFKFPSAFRKLLLPVLEEGFIIKESLFDECLELIPKGVFNEDIAEKMKILNPFNQKDRVLIRKISEGSLVELDAVGRLMIPSDQLRAKNISKDIVLISRVNIIEVWDVQTYKEVNSKIMDFADIAEQRLGNLAPLKTEARSSNNSRSEFSENH